MNSSDVVGYTYAVENLCLPCVRRIAAFDHEANGHAADYVPLETLLDAWAERQDINREDESSYDSGDFPKVIVLDMVQDGEECGKCGEELV